MSEGQKGSLVSIEYQVASIETLNVGVGSPDPRFFASLRMTIFSHIRGTRRAVSLLKKNTVLSTPPYQNADSP